MVRRKAVKSPKAKVAKSAVAKERAFNQKAQWKAFKELEAQADKAWKKFQSDVKKKAKLETLLKDRNHLLLLLGECNYMARECMKLAAKGKKRS